MRAAGTLLGCLLVLVFAWLQQYWQFGMVSLLAVDVAHAFINVRHLVTVMAWLQAHMAPPAGRFNIGKRLADAVLCAPLAWIFAICCRPGAPDRQRARASGHETLRLAELGQANLSLRLARREFYEAMGGIAARAQRSRAEPALFQFFSNEATPVVHGFDAFQQAGRRGSMIVSSEATATMESGRISLARVLFVIVGAGSYRHDLARHIRQ